jgi:hypothetical protein
VRVSRPNKTNGEFVLAIRLACEDEARDISTRDDHGKRQGGEQEWQHTDMETGMRGSNR